MKLVMQNRKEYDDLKLYETLSDPEVWRMLSKSDPAKVASLTKLNVISEDKIMHTYSLKTVTLLQVDKNKDLRERFLSWGPLYYIESQLLAFCVKIRSEADRLLLRSSGALVRQ